MSHILYFTCLEIEIEKIETYYFNKQQQDLSTASLTLGLVSVAL